MDIAHKRQYRSAKFGVNVGTSVAPEIFYEIERLANEFRVTRSEVTRRLLLRGLIAYLRDGNLSTPESITTDGSVSTLFP